ncbi:MAG: AI-2E family transporter [Oscillospiraceae bacterium]|nr:AI-2E family transporter [Oscillospiraceae bacterium]
MRRRFRWDKKYLYWGITAFLVIAAAVVFYMLLQHLPDLRNAWNKGMTIVAPFVWGLVIAYLLLPLTRALEKLLSSRKMKKALVKGKFARIAAIVVSEIVLLIILTAFVLLILPQLYSSIETIVVNSPEYYAKMSDWIELKLEDHPEMEQYVAQALESLSNQLLDLVKNRLLPSMGNVITSVTTGVYAAFRGVYNLIVGIIVSIYVLSNREIAKAGFRKVLYSIFTIETAEKIRTGLIFTDKTFMGFLSGKLLDSAIIGLICYIVCLILKMPYTLLVSVIIGITNIIPFFGPLIGAIPSAFIILLVDPLKCLIFVIFILILQQIDGNILGPKILGSTVGINGFWIMFAIIMGGGLFGFAGMILGVPVFVVIYSAVTTLIDKKLRRDDLPQDFETYSRLDYIDPATREVHLKKSGD